MDDDADKSPRRYHSPVSAVGLDASPCMILLMRSADESTSAVDQSTAAEKLAPKKSEKTVNLDDNDDKTQFS